MYGQTPLNSQWPVFKNSGANFKLAYYGCNNQALAVMTAWVGRLRVFVVFLVNNYNSLSACCFFLQLVSQLTIVESLTYIICMYDNMYYQAHFLML